LEAADQLRRGRIDKLLDTVDTSVAKFQEQAEQEATHVQVPPRGIEGGVALGGQRLRTSRALEAHPEIGDVVVDFNEFWGGLRLGGRRRDPGASAEDREKLVTWVIAVARELARKARRLGQVITQAARKMRVVG
jgi:hypothetical protein